MNNEEQSKKLASPPPPDNLGPNDELTEQILALKEELHEVERQRSVFLEQRDQYEAETKHLYNVLNAKNVELQEVERQRELFIKQRDQYAAETKHLYSLLDAKNKVIAHEYCTICDGLNDFVIDDSATLLREARCTSCGSSIRNHDIYSIVLENFSPKTLSGLKILHTASYGAIYNKLNDVFNNNFTEEFGICYYSEFFDNIQSGCRNDSNVLCVDLCKIPFDDNTLDLIITEDVLEHVEDIKKVFMEIDRVLKRNGVHIFSVPVNENIKTRFLRGENIEIRHPDGLRAQGAPVYTEFGYDTCKFAKTRNTFTEWVCKHRYYSPKQTTDLVRDYDEYCRVIDQPLNFYRYNSNVFIQKKHSFISMRIKDTIKF